MQCGNGGKGSLAVLPSFSQSEFQTVWIPHRRIDIAWYDYHVDRQETASWDISGRPEDSLP